MARAALRALYPHEPPGGGMDVQLGPPEAEGTTGVVAQVFTLVTGAATANGFHGIGGRFVRRGLLRYGAGNPGVRLRRRDTGATAQVELDLDTVPPAPELRQRMAGALAAEASAAHRMAFGELWQDRVRRLLLEHADDPQVIRLERLA